MALSNKKRRKRFDNFLIFNAFNPCQIPNARFSSLMEFFRLCYFSQTNNRASKTLVRYQRGDNYNLTT